MASMSDPAGWEPLKKTRQRAGADAFHLSPFARLARTHVLSTIGDALVTIALANSLFFSLDPNDARWKVFLYLALTMAPLAIVTPFIGPALDRSVGGRRWMVVGVSAARALLCLIMIDDLQGLLLFPEAFGVLAMGRAYMVSRAALVPTVVHSDSELVEANSKLQLLSGLAVPLAAIPAGVAFVIGGSQGVLVVAVLAYASAALAALRIPATQVAAAPATAVETAELRGAGIILAASAMGLVRGVVGFITFLLLFDLRDAPTWNLGAVLAVTGAAALVGSAVAPMLRRSQTEERMLKAVLAGAILAALGAAWQGGLVASMGLAAVVALVATIGRLAFDSIVQRDAPDANRGRSFATFELRFQLVWVVGAIVPVAILIPVRAGFLIIAGVSAFALFSYTAGRRAAHLAHRDRTSQPVDDPAPTAVALAPDPTLHDATAVQLAVPEADRSEVDAGQPEPRGIDLGGGG